MDIVLLILLILVLLALVFLYGKWQSLALLLQDQAEDTADNLSDQLSYQLENATLKQQQAIHQEVERLRTELYQQLTDIRQELNKSHLETRDATDRRLQAIQESNENAWKKCGRQLRKNWRKPCKPAYKPPLKRCPSNWNRSIVVWVKCRRWRVMWVVLTRCCLAPKPVASWVNYSWDRLSRIF